MKLTFIEVLRNAALCIQRLFCSEQLQLLTVVRDGRPVKERSARTQNKTLLLAMKITGILLLVAGLHASAGSFSQEVTLKAHNMPLKDVLSEVRKQTGYTFFFKKGALSKTRPVTVTALKMPLATFLDEALKDQPLKYEISVKTITLLPRPDAVVAFDNQQKKWAWFQEIKGIVTGENGTPLAGASVKVKGTSAGTSTDAYGRFTINAEPGQTLVVSFIGYTDQQIKVAQQTSINIQLERTETSLEAVVVNKGYYTEKQRVSAGNVSTVKAADIERQPVGNPLAAMQGRVPGMVITQTTGVPGSAFRVQIRGRNSINSGNDPLYVVDGVPYPATLLNGLFTVNGDITNGGNPLASINTQDIESIDVLKDADATAIYGSRGANGVVLITTKKGKAGKPQININIAQGIGQVGKFMKLLDRRQYLDMRYEAYRNDKVDWTALATGFVTDLKYYDTTRYTDWQKELIGGNAQYTDAQISMSGGGSNVNYLMGGNYHRETTVFPGSTAYQRGAMHFSVGAQSNDQRLKVALTGGYSVDKNNLPRTDLMDFALNLPPVGPPLYNDDGSLNWAGSNWLNPISRMRAYYERKVNNFTGNLVVGYRLFKDLEIKSTFGYTNTLVNETSTYPISMYNPTSGVTSGSAEYGTMNNTTWVVEPQLNYVKNIWKGTLTALVGSTIQKNMTNGYGINATGFISDALLKFPYAAGSYYFTGAQVRSYKYNSLYARVNYNIDDKYIINLTARRDGSDRFGDDKRFGDFGAAGIAWVFSRENLIADHLPFLSFGKLRASYGTTGNDAIGDYQFIRTYNISGNPPVFQGVRGLTPSGHHNPDYAWETNRKMEAGLELGFLNDKLNTTISYYRNRSGNQLVGYRLPAHTGFTSVTANWPALVENKGWEITFNVSNVKLGPVNWNSYFNISWNRNKLVEFPDIEKTPYRQTLLIGKPLDLYRTYDYVGMDDSKGMYLFRTKAGKIVNGVDGPDYLSSLTDMTVLLNRAPEYFGGFQNNFSYKGFDLDLTFQFTKQIGKAYTAQFQPGAASPTQGNQHISVLDRWQKAGDGTTKIRFNADRAISWNQTYYVDSYANYMDASFIRLKNIQLAYDLSRVLPKTGLKMIRVYIQAQNVFTITDYIGMDPENLNAASLPPLRMITAGLKVTI